MIRNNDIIENKAGSDTLGKEVVVEVTDLHKHFGDQQVLQGTSITLYKGENLVVLGKSGTGKSVLIKCIVGLLKPDAGTVKVFEDEVTSVDYKRLNEIRKKVGFLFQNGALYDSMTVKQNLEFPLKRIRKDLKKDDIATKISEALEAVGLPEAIDKMPSELSGGMRKRISLARTIIVDPSIMLYDEPTTGLDPLTSDEISELIVKVKNKYKTSSIIITHDIRCAIKTADRVILLDEGKVYQEGTLEEFINSSDEMIRSFFQNNN